MDDIYEKIVADTTKFNLGDEEEWRELYEPFQPEPSPEVRISSNHRYGPAERNLLDVYYKPNDKTPNKPVVVYIHGGGFFSGDKRWSEKFWGNVGRYFAGQGMVVVIVNHQLVSFDRPGATPSNKPSIKYPAGADDVQKIREWVYENIAADEFGNGSPQKVVLLGHSSGGAHIAMNLYADGDPERRRADTSQPLFPPVAGVVYLSTPFWFDNKRPIRRQILQKYYGSDAEEAWGHRTALGLLRNLPDNSPVWNANELPTYVGTVRWEVKEAFDGAIAFLHAYREKSRPAETNPLFHILDKHNHVSNVLSIGTQDTAQAKMLLDFVQSCTQPSSNGMRSKL